LNDLFFHLSDKTRADDFSRKDESGIRAPGYSPPQFEDKKTTVETENNEFEGVCKLGRIRSNFTFTDFVSQIRMLNFVEFDFLR